MKTTFEALGLDEVFLRAITDLGFETPSGVQEQAIPPLLEKDMDMVALAQTGTGKTAAFGFPMLQKIDVTNRDTQAIVLSPTRELCLQLTKEIQQYGKYLPGLNVVAVYGGASISEQARQLRRGAQIIVATPGRMKDMISRRMVDISKIDYCVLDEADEMLNMGFYEDITDILSHTPNTKYTWLFSATMPKEVSRIASKFMKDPLEITVGSKNMGATNVSHEYYVVNARDRYAALKSLADVNPDIFSVVFCRTKRDTQRIAENLIEDGYSAAAIHGDLSQSQRDMVMNSFRNKQIQMLVATDVASRGIDVDDITHVINYQLPDEVEIYTHRSGRTGRAGKEGVSIVIATRGEQRKIKMIERIIQQKFTQKEIPTGKEICEVQLYHLANSIKNTEINESIDEYLPEINTLLESFTKEELIKKFFSVEFTKFHNYYKKKRDINVDASQSTASDDDSVRYFLNVGERDDLNWQRLKDFLVEVLSVQQDEVFRVDVMNTFSFFNTDKKHQEKVLEILPTIEWEGRKLSVEVSTSKPGGRGRRGGGGRDRNRARGGQGGGRRRRRASGRRSEPASSRARSGGGDIKNTRGRRRRR
ncbi:MAG TPA: DEAD/DEAH box helicase [Flavobacteriaceae bacterium]|nr:DEAD/DEAH box helicase [Flavobacteriaceae bacterium]